MQLSPDIRYVKDGVHQLAVSFDGCYFTAYHVGSENVGVNISMEIVVGVYPEVSDESLIRIGHYQNSNSTHGVWALILGAEEGIPPIPKGVVSELDDMSWPTLINIQQRLSDITHDGFDLIKTLVKTVEALDDVVASPSKASRWAKALVPILQASGHEGISISDIIHEISNEVRRLERRQRL